MGNKSGMDPSYELAEYLLLIIPISQYSVIYKTPVAVARLENIGFWMPDQVRHDERALSPQVKENIFTFRESVIVGC